MPSNTKNKNDVAILEDLRNGAPATNMGNLPCLLAQRVLKDYSHEEINSLYDSILNALTEDKHELIKYPERFREDLVDLLLLAKSGASTSKLINQHSFNKLLSTITVKALAFEFYNAFVEIDQNIATKQRELALKSALYMQSFIIDPDLVNKEISTVMSRMGKRSVEVKSDNRKPFEDYICEEFNKSDGKFNSVRHAAKVIANRFMSNTPEHLTTFRNDDTSNMIEAVRRVIRKHTEAGTLILNKV
jgi:hypothetical protein